MMAALPFREVRGDPGGGTVAGWKGVLALLCQASIGEAQSRAQAEWTERVGEGG